MINKLGTKLNNFADMLGLNPYSSNGKLIKRLQPISKKDIQPIIILCPPSFSCSDKKCKGCWILQSTDNTDVPHVTLIKGSEIFKNVAVLSGHCTNCKTHYFPDYENYKDNLGSRKRVYLPTANYLKIGQSLYVDRVFSNAVMNGIYSFHASTAAYAEFWTNSYGKPSGFKVNRRQLWQTFIQESVHTLSQASNIFFEVADNSSIEDLTRDAYAILGEQGGIRLADKHACSECTQEYKAVADWIPAANDAAAVLGVDENRDVPALNADVPRAETRDSPGPTEDDAMDVDVENKRGVVKMVVMDGIVMGPTHCAFDGCTGALANARGHGESFCVIHRTEF